MASRLWKLLCNRSHWRNDIRNSVTVAISRFHGLIASQIRDLTTTTATTAFLHIVVGYERHKNGDHDEASTSFDFGCVVGSRVSMVSSCRYEDWRRKD